MAKSINPTKGFTVRPKKGWTFEPKIKTDEYGNTSLRKVKGEWKLGPRTPQKTYKNKMRQTVQTYYDEGGKRIIEKVYSRDYSMIKGTENLLAVKASGQRGWLTPEGKFIGEEDFRKLLYAIDQTNAAKELIAAKKLKINLVGKWDSLRPIEKARVVDALRDMNWEQFWNEFAPGDDTNGTKFKSSPRRRRKAPTLRDRQYQMLDNLVEKIAAALGE